MRKQNLLWLLVKLHFIACLLIVGLRIVGVIHCSFWVPTSLFFGLYMIIFFVVGAGVCFTMFRESLKNAILLKSSNEI